MRLAVLLTIVLTAACSAVSAAGFVKADGPKLVLGGKDYRAIGVNLPHLHVAYNGTWHHTTQIYGTRERARQAMVDAIADAGRNHVAFIRFFAGPGYPLNIDALYARDKDSYWKQMDEVVTLCRKSNIKLIPSFNAIDVWHWYYNESKSAILEPKSRTYKGAYRYIREFVTRYKNDPTILMWEITNEGMLASDVDQKDRDGLPAECYRPGAPRRAKLAREDSFTWDMLLRYYKEQTEFIKSLDPNHIVTSGDASVRAECTSRRETFPDFKYRTDTYKEWIANNLVSQPKPLDIYSYHMYGSANETKSWENHFDIPPVEFYKGLIRATHASGRPIFVGEFGQYKPSFRTDRQALFTRGFIDMMDTEGVSLAALWAWHFPWQVENDVTGANQLELMKRIAEFNRKYAGL